MSAPQNRRPLSSATRRHILQTLLDQAEQGDVAAAEALVRLSLTASAARSTAAAARRAAGAAVGTGA